MPKAHPNSDDPGFEWRVSFSLVEKRILRKIYYLFRKVYLICKKISVIEKWKKQYNFASYILKTAFLWTLEEKWSKPDNFTEENILSMIVEIFSYLKKYFEEDNIPNYFIPEMNILEQYSQTVEKDSMKTDKLIEKLTNLTNKTFLIQYICGTFNTPFSPIIGNSLRSEDLSIFSISKDVNSSSKILTPRGSIFIPSHHHFYQWYEKVILLDRGLQEKEDETELLCELYITFLYFLHARIFEVRVFVKEENQQLFQHILYFIYVFGRDLLSFDLDSIMKYCKSIINYFSLIHPLDKSYEVCTLMDLYNNINAIKIHKFRSKYKIDIPQKDWFNGRFSDDSIPLIHVMNEYGSEKHSKVLQKKVEEVFLRDDDKFEVLVKSLNEYFRKKFYDRCFIERQTENSRYDIKGYFLNCLVDHMSEMYDYGFIEMKSFLPKPAVYISYLSQLLLNVKCCVKNHIDVQDEKKLLDEEKVVPHWQKDDILDAIGSPINSETEFDKWGFTLKDGDYISYEQRKHTTIPFTWIYLDNKLAVRRAIGELGRERPELILNTLCNHNSLH